MRLTQVFVFLCCLIMAQTAFADKVYLEYNSACMDIYEYHYNGNTTGKGHIVYHIRLNDMEKVILEVGVEARLNQPRKPNKSINCDDLALNERMVRQINNGATQLYIVKKDGRGYNVSPVGIATYAQIKPTSTGYSTLDTRFSFNFDQPANGINLATNGSETRVVYKGLVSNSCPKSYLFDKTRERGGRSFSSYVIVPEIGIIEEKNGFNANDAQNSVLKLVKINGKPYQKYIETYCSTPEAGTNNSFYSNGRFPSKSKFLDRTKKPSMADMESGNNNKTNGNTTTSTIKDNPFKTNNLPNTSPSNCTVYKDLDRNIYMDFATGLPANTECGGNTYINGRRLGENVGPAIAVPNTNTRPTTTTTAPPPPPTDVVRTNTSGSNCNSVSAYGKHVVQREETLYGISRLYGLTLAQIRTYNPGLNGTTIYPCMTIYTKAVSKGSPEVSTDYKAKQHTVKRGETLYQLASKYGYTVDRFRHLNGIGPNETIYPGQILKTDDCNCEAGDNPGVSYVPSEYNAGTARIDNGGQSVSAQPAAKRRFHIVAEDDTVYSISKQYSISVSALRKINDLEENEIIIPYQRIYLQ